MAPVASFNQKLSERDKFYSFLNFEAPSEFYNDSPRKRRRQSDAEPSSVVTALENSYPNDRIISVALLFVIVTTLVVHIHAFIISNILATIIISVSFLLSFKPWVC